MGFLLRWYLKCDVNGCIKGLFLDVVNVCIKFNFWINFWFCFIMNIIWYGFFYVFLILLRNFNFFYLWLIWDVC